MDLKERTEQGPDAASGGGLVELGRAEPGLWAWFKRTEFGRSIFRTPGRATPRDRAAGHWSNFFLHIYPVKMHRAEAAFRYSWYLGVI
ncbi:MAG: hypothetical protein OER95_05700, partial [Acidimicrobiia bacterium]|nr:hypothetical protein [Acidimicrobiia bacterium]